MTRIILDGTDLAVIRRKLSFYVLIASEPIVFD
jgi:hypothetical protein